MGAARRLAMAAVGVVALATAGGATLSVLAVSTSTDAAFRERSHPFPVEARPTVAPTAAEARPTVAPTAAPTVAGTEAARVTVTPKPAPEPVLEPGDRGVRVRELQGRLSQLAWFTPPMTGRYERTTIQGVRGFQAKRGLEATGAVDPRTWRRLVRMTRMPSDDELFNRAGPALYERGDSGRAVRVIQARLRQLAWFFGDVSDHYGDRTVAAVRGFQGKRHVPVTGKVDRRSLTLLVSMSRTPTAAELANKSPEPADGAALDARCRTGRTLCIDKTSSSLRWVVDGRTRMSLDVRFGSEYTPTREGVFSVYWKHRDHVSNLYGSAMPFAMFFSRGQAVHYSSDFAARGYAGASHGCVNVRDYSSLASLFAQVRTGDKVVVYRS
jgi:peptidoglycan hydrolase-like protein with peptidoglycan-binding domain